MIQHIHNHPIDNCPECKKDQAMTDSASLKPCPFCDEGQYSRRVGVVEWVGLRDALAAYRAQVTKEGG